MLDVYLASHLLETIDGFDKGLKDTVSQKTPFVCVNKSTQFSKHREASPKSAHMPLKLKLNCYALIANIY